MNLTVPLNILIIFQARLLGTIGVARGFGDHDLRVYESEVFVKPFMTCAPEVRFDMFNYAKPFTKCNQGLR